jgi:non-ribosomal peptide synthetase component E (peptide arylation enzyme)
MAPRYAIDGIRYRSSAGRDRYIANGDWIDSTVGEVVRQAAIRNPDKVAIVGHDRDLTFRELDDASEKIAAGLLASGLRPADRALFQIGTVTEFFTAFFGCFKAGIVPVCTLPQYREIEMEALARRSGAKVLLVQADVNASFDQLEFARKLQRTVPALSRLVVVRGEAQPGEYALSDFENAIGPDAARQRVLPHDPAPEDVVAFQMSGGSTGLPKLIPRFHAEYLGAAAALSRRWELTGDDKALWTLPLIHNAGALIVVLPMVLDCRTTIVMPRFDALEFLATAERRGVTFSGSIGPVAPKLLEFDGVSRFDLKALRQFFALSRADAVEAHMGVTTGNMYGITEGLLMGSAPSDNPQARHGSIGWPVAEADEIQVLQPGTDTEVDPGSVGELCFRGPSTLTGYFGDPDATSASFTSDGFFRSGDLVRALVVDGRTYYAFEGRIKDNINRGGEKIGAEEVEVVVAGHPAIADVRVVAMPDLLYGEKACAYVILRPGHPMPTLDDLGRFMIGKGIAKYKIPERIERIDAFPTTSVGKVDKVRMRAMIAGKLAIEAGASPPDTHQDKADD